MLVLSRYQIIEEIHSGLSTVIYRAYDQLKQRPIIIKVPKSEYPTLEEITRFRQEYSINQSINYEGIVKTYSLEKYRNGFVLILEDFGGQSLSQILAVRKLLLREILRIAIELTETLNYLHQIPIIHKDIKPSNIIINPTTKQIKLADFSISSRLDWETSTMSNPNQLIGTLAYMSPEQSGRMNRLIDYRTDFYSLGVTLYEMLTGQLPFPTTDLIELIHSHIAKQPVPPEKFSWVEDLTPPAPLPCEGRGDKSYSPPLAEEGLGERSPLKTIPKAVSDIVMKLLSKTAEKRYQTASGLKYDLEFCLRQLETTNSIPNFAIGKRDKSAQLLIPQKLYGREEEIVTVLSAFERVSQGATEILLVSGYSGIGKTSVVNEVHKPIVGARGYFIGGKFDQFKRNIPYSALIQAFQDLTRQILTLSQPEIENFQHHLREALGQNGQVLIDVIPEIELIIGSQPPVPQLGSTESQNRFNRVFQQFIRVFCQPEHPLVLFLDDLQWADSASLKLIEILMTDSNSQYLLMIGAYRDNEVSPTHPFVQTINKIEETSTSVNNITLRPLSLHHVSWLVADTLGETTPDTQSLTELLFNKTQGNPFFLTTLLKTLYSEKLLAYDVNSDRWQWDIEAIQAIGIIDTNIVELIARNIQKLPSDTVRALKLAACIGNHFSLEVLATVSETSQLTTAQSLWDALQAGLILPLNEAYKIPLVFGGEEEPAAFVLSDVKIDYRFLHDRVQQAAYSLIPESERKETHLKIGQLLLANTTPESRKDNIFALVNQLNFGTDLIVVQTKKDELAYLNLIAGQKAKTATAYEAAANYLNVGMGLLAEDSWQSNYDLTHDLHVEAVEAEYLNTNFERATFLAEVVLQKATNLLDKVKVYELKIQMCMAQVQMQLAIDMGLQLLEMLGVTLEQEPPKDLKVEELINLPEMTEPYKLAAMQLIIKVIPPVYVANPALLPSLLFTVINLCIKYGNSSPATYGYAMYGLLLCGPLLDIENGYPYGELAVMLLDKLNAIEFRSRVLGVFNAYTRHWKEHIKETIEPLNDAANCGLENGDIEGASYSAANYCTHLLFSGEYLEYVENKTTQCVNLMEKLKQEFGRSIAGIYQQIVLNFQGKSAEKTSLIGEGFNESEMLPKLIEVNNLNVLFVVYLCKNILFYLFKEAALAVENGKIAEKYTVAVPGMISVTQHNFYYSLALLAHYPNANEQEQSEYLLKVESNQQIMKLWAYHAPCNFQHKYDLIEAEKARALGQISEAISLYDKAISGASEQGYIQEEALANELAAEFHLEHGNQKIAQFYLTEAYYGYIRWGAKAKVTDLESRYPHILDKIITRKAPAFEIDKTVTSTTSSKSETLDLASVMKAYQAISIEIVLPNLLEKLMRIAIENAGAQTGYLILERSGSLALEAFGQIDSGEINVETSRFADITEAVPMSVINYVQRTKRSLVLSNAKKDKTFNTDPFIAKNKPLSILCTSILNQGQFIGIFYLENNLSEGAFTSERLEVLQLLSSQAGISIENARLVADLSCTSAKLKQANEQLENYNRTLEAKVQERTQELQTKEARLAEAQRIAHLGSWEIDLTTKQLIWSDEVFRIFGLDPARGLPTFAEHSQQIHPDDFDLWEQTLQQASETGEPYELDLRILRPDNSTRYLFVKGESILNDSGQVIKLIGTALDITDRKLAEQALQESEKQLREQATQLEKALRELQLSQTQMIHTEKMSSLGQLVAGVAHEINNPVNFIYGNLAYTKEYTQQLLRLIDLYRQTYPHSTAEIEAEIEAIELDFLKEDLSKLLESMRFGSERIRQIVLSLRSFSRLDESSSKRVDLHEGIESTLMLLQPRLREEGGHLAIEVIKEYDQLPKVACYAADINQVFMNILSNAIDALETVRQSDRDKLPTIRITTELDRSKNAIVRIADNGPGMTEAVLSKIFDPFFTTKPIGSGTGLGLSVSYQIIVDKHGGKLNCTSTPGEGAIFTISIPIELNTRG